MKTTQKRNLRFLTQGALIGALYVLLTYLAFWMGLDKGVIQLRFSEALCVLAAFTPAAIPGLTVGCVLANFLTGAHFLDVVFGSFATLLGALGGYMLRRFALKSPKAILVTIPTVLANMLIVPLLLIFVYGVPDAYPFLLCTVGAGELLSASVLGTILLLALLPHKKRLFRE